MNAQHQLERELIDAMMRLHRLREISVPDVARLLKKDVEWVRANFPIIVHGPKSHHILVADVEAYQARRTIWPKFKGKAA